MQPRWFHVQGFTSGLWVSERSPYPRKPVLGDDEVHLIFFALDERAADCEHLLDVLDEDERRRAARFHFSRDRVRYVAAHVALRDVVARTLGLAPHAVRWKHGAYGKPAIAEHPELGVNLAHSVDRAVIAVAWQREVGVDLEGVRELDELETAKVVFSSAEQAALRARADDRRDTFFRIWASKEALVKALGDGLGGPLTAFDVAAEPDVREVLIANRLEDPRAWSIRRIEAGPGYAAAVAASSPPWRTVIWDGIECPWSSTNF
jgi:4'-phosphopantetheinyl transferase